MARRLPLSGLAAFTATAMLLVAAPSASAVDEVNSKKLRDAVTVGGILAHERAFQRIANQNGGNRASGLPGYDASADYVKRRLSAAGYEVSEQVFTFPFFQELAPSAFSQATPTAKDYAPLDPSTSPATGDFSIMEYSGSGDVTAPVVPVDVLVPPGPTPSSSTSGCEAADFAGFPAGAIALVQRGTCDFVVKAANAEAAKAGAVVIFNEGQPGREDVLNGTLGGPDVTIPVIGTSFAVGEELVTAARAGEVTARVSTTTQSETRTTKNVFGDSVEGDAGKTAVVGAHLDSVPEGAGINDNGSGTAGILEIAEEMSDLGIKPRQKVRFAFWGAEESGLLGSEHYVETLTDEGREAIFANLNFDMIGSPNYVRFVYDGDGSAFDFAGPPGSAQIENEIFGRYFASQGLATLETQFDGRSDYKAFIDNGIPAGGLFSGAEGVKTPEQAAVFGGTAGLAYDPNYHQAGDTISNLSTKSLFELGDAAAHATLTLARTRSGFFEDGSRRRSADRADLEFKGSHLVK